MTFEVFFSYDSEDDTLVRRLRDGIENRIQGDVEVYIFEDDPNPGGQPSRTAMEGIRASDAFLVLVTPNSQQSQWVQQEIGYAKGQDCHIIPVVLDHPETELTGLLAGNEYLLFDPEDPETFFETFQEYATAEWETELRGGDRPSGPDDPDDEGDADVHPVLAGVPVGRLLTFTRLHAFELGVYVGVLTYVVVWLTVPDVVERYPQNVLGVLLVGGLRVVHSRWRVGRDGTTADHALGLHDFVRAPVSALVTMLYVLWVSTPALV